MTKKESTNEELIEYGLENEGSYGCGPCKSKSFACLNNVGFFTVMLSIGIMIQAGSTHGLIPISMTSIEKRFELESWMIGLFFVFYELGFILLSLYISFGLKWKVSTTTGVSMLTLGTGLVLFSLPHFFTGLYEYKNDGDEHEICMAEAKSLKTSLSKNFDKFYVIFITQKL